ncbi:MAG: FAD-binding oxidoreductase [Chloroflexi bacterium]|nr:FAD-binding oxidoreductase [Chloroflexota bacterium]
MRTEIVVIGGGIIGCAAAAMLATRGARVTLVEGVAIGAGASGRNLGAIQHPFDPELAPLYRESLTRYRALVDATGEFSVGDAPAGLLLLNRSEEAAAEQVLRQRDAVPELDARLIAPDELARIEPSLAPGFTAIRLETGFPVPPASATGAWAALAHERGVVIEIGQAAQPTIENGAAVGVELADGTRIAADAVLVAAGPWTPKLVDPTGGWSPIHPTWGVTVQLRLDGAAPAHIVEEDEVDAINRSDAATARAAAAAGDEPPTLFSLASAGGLSTLGSTFLPYEPEPAATVALLLRRGAEFLPAIGQAEVVERRMCARPQSVDGRPFIGRAPGVDGLFVCAGHGPWGISTGPASAAIVARAILDGTPPPPALDAGRPVPTEPSPG